VTVNGLAISGAAAQNYRLAYTTVTGNIGIILPAMSPSVVMPNVAQHLLLDFPESTNNLEANNIVITNKVGVNPGVIPQFQGNAGINAIPVTHTSMNARYSPLLQTALGWNVNLVPNGFKAIAASMIAETLKPVAENKNKFRLFAISGPAVVALIRALEDFQIILLLAAMVSISTAIKSISKLRGRKSRTYLPIISFKVRSALDTIIGFTQLMYNGNVGKISKEQKEFLGNVLSQSNTLISEFKVFETEFKNAKFDAKALARMSFELRTALNGIIGFTSIICHADIGSVSSQQKKFLEDILAASNQLLILIPDKETV
jgi:hypothetical protein